MSNSVASTIIFSDFCDLLDDIKNNSKQEYKHSKLVKFIKEYRAKAKKLAEINPSVETSFYPVLRLLLPKCERERGPYGLREVALAKSIIKMLGLPPKGEDANILKKFQSVTSANDFAEAAHNVLRKHFSGSKSLNVSEINDRLNAIAKKNSDNDIRGQEDEIFNLFKLTSPNEQRWIIRIILKEVNLGLGHNKILRLYHPDAVTLYDSNNSLLKTCETLHDPSVRINEIEITLFTPFRPMLSQRCDAKQFLKTVTGGAKFTVETKFDGERFQLHMSDGKFKYFSRNGFNYTQNYGCDYNTGIFTPLLKNVFKSNVRSIILDGEMMGWNTDTKQFGSKGMNFDVKKLSDTSKHQPCFCVFDVVLLNDVVQTNKPFKQRIVTLESILSPIEGVIMVSRKTEAKCRQDILDALNTSMDKGDEGIVFKNAESLYIPNDRKSGWWKMKLEYFSNVMSDLDVIIMGAYKKSNRVNDFLVGVAVPAKYGNPTKFLSFAKIGTGLNSDELESIDKKLGKHWKQPVDDECETHGLYFGREKPDLWIEPQKSCILLVRGSELTKLHRTNPDFKAKYTLRFPRILAIRFDKPYYDCLTSIELDELTADGTVIKKLYKRHLELGDIESEGRKFKKRKSKFHVDETEAIEASNEVLRGLEFCVLSGTKDWVKLEAERAILLNGGTVVKMEGRNTFCILIGDDHSRTKYYKGDVDMVKLNWLRKVLDQQNFTMYKPEDVIYTTTATKNRFMSEYDKYGDSYTDEATEASLQLVFKNIADDYINPTSSEITTFHEIINFPYEFDLFRDRLAYFDKYKVINEPESQKIFASTLSEVDFKFWGGNVSEYLSKEVDMVIVNSDNEVRIEVISNYLSQIRNKNAKIVTKDYISEKVSEFKSACPLFTK